jgi:bacterioferritin-associated ferredoxin
VNHLIICVCNNVSEKQLLDDIKNNKPLSSGNSCCRSYIIEFLKSVHADDYLKQLETSD